MFHLIKQGKQFAVSNISDNGRYVGGNSGFNTRNSAYKNMWSQVLSGVGEKIKIERIKFQDDTGSIGIITYLLPSLHTVQTNKKPRKKYITKKKR